MPEGNNIDHLQIEVDAEIGAATRKINELATALHRLSDVDVTVKKSLFSSLTESLKPLSELKLSSVGSTISAIVRLSKAMDKMARVETIDVNIFENLATALSKLSNVKLTGIGSFLSEIRKIPETLEKFKDVNIGEYVGKIQEFVNVLEPLAVRLKEVNTALQNVAKTTIKINVKESKVVKEGEVAKAKEATANYSNLLGVMKKLAAPVKKAAAAFGGLLKNIGSHVVNAFTSKLRGIINGVQRLYHSIQRVVLMRAIRAALRQITAGFKEGIDNLYQWSAAVDGRFKGSMDKLATSMLYLKNSIAAMVAPIINKLAPAIDYLVDRFVDLLNIVNQVFAALTGNNTWTRAVKYPVEYAESVADAAKDTADGYKEAAKELKLFLLPFDELNTLTKDKEAGTSASPSSGKGGGGGLNYAEMFETRELEDWAKKIKDLIDQGDWYGAGQALADHLNELIEQWDAHEFGTKVAEKLNEGVRFGLGFMRRFGWEELGGKFGGLLNGFAETFSWEEFGALLGTKVNAVSGFLKGFFKQFNGSTFGKGLGKLFNGWVKEIKVKDITDAFELGVEDATQIIISFFETVDYELLAQQIADLLTGCDWENIMSQVWEVAKAAIGATWKLGSALVDNLWNGYETDENGNKVSNPQKAKYGKGIVLGGATLGAGAVGLSALSGLLKAAPTIAKLVKLFGEGGALAGVGSALGSALPWIVSIAGGATGLGIGVASEANAIKNGSNWKNALGTVGGGAMAGAGIGGVVGLAGAGPLGLIAGAGIGMQTGVIVTAWTKAIQEIIEHWDKIKEVASEVFDWISQAWSDVCDWFSEKWQIVSDWFSEKWSAISEWVDTNVIQPVKAVVEPIVAWFKDLFEGIGIIFEAFWITSAKIVDTLFVQPAIRFWNNFVENLAKLIEWFKTTKFYKFLENLVSQFKKGIETLKAAWNVGWEFMSRVVSGILSTIKTAFVETWNYIKSTFITPLVNAMSAVGNAIVSGFKTAFYAVEYLAGSIVNGIIGEFEAAINAIISGLNVFIGVFNIIASRAAAVVGKDYGGLGEIGYISLGRINTSNIANNLSNSASDTGMYAADAFNNVAGAGNIFGSLGAIFGDALSGGNSTNTVNVNVELDGERVGRSVVNYVNQRTIADGMSPMYG